MENIVIRVARAAFLFCLKKRKRISAAEMRFYSVVTASLSGTISVVLSEETKKISIVSNPFSFKKLLSCSVAR